MVSNELDVVKRWVGDSESWLKSFIENVASNGRIACVVAMGSAVREKGHRRSDLDLLILYEGERPRVKAPVEVDIRKYPVEDVDRLIAEGHEILCWAIKFGCSIYDRSDTWASLEEKWRDHVPMPSSEEANRRARKSHHLTKDMIQVGDDVAASDLLLAALTQFARAKLIRAGRFPASRPELPNQLRSTVANDPLADLLDDAMHGNSSPSELLAQYDAISPRRICASLQKRPK